MSPAIATYAVARLRCHMMAWWSCPVGLGGGGSIQHPSPTPIWGCDSLSAVIMLSHAIFSSCPLLVATYLSLLRRLIID